MRWPSCVHCDRKTIEAEVIHQGKSEPSLVHIQVAAEQWVFPPENLRGK